MNILLIGSGGREHALAWKMNQSPLVDIVHSVPGNPGMDEIGPCFDISADDIDGLEKLTLQIEPDLVVIGPEAPLALGLADRLRARGFDVFGPSAEAAQLESSKAFSKARMADYGVPTARYGCFQRADAAKAFLSQFEPPYVLKADGLAAGKGVVIAKNRTEAESEIDAMLSGKFGAASKELIIEEFMPGEEVSLFVLTDGEGAIYLPAAQDHKRAFDGDTGPNTGGMGAYAPAPILDAICLNEIKTAIVTPMLEGMARDGRPYQGVLYVGLMMTPEGAKVVEFNARFGDPECQALMAGLSGDIVPALLICATGGLKGQEAAYESLLELDQFHPTACVVMASQGYPGAYTKGGAIKGIQAAERHKGVKVFQAGSDKDAEGKLIANGGRVLAVTATADNLDDAFDTAYSALETIDFPDGFYRLDIGWRVRRQSHSDR